MLKFPAMLPFSYLPCFMKEEGGSKKKREEDDVQND